MDGQRQYPSEPERWYGEDDLSRVPGPRGSDPTRSDAPRFGDAEPYSPQYGETAYPDAAGYGAADSGFGDQRYTEPGYDDAPTYPGSTESGRRRSPSRPRRLGRRPNHDASDDDGSVVPGEAQLDDDGPIDGHYRSAERIDRSALRRPSDGDVLGGQPDLRAAEPQTSVIPPSASAQSVPAYVPVYGPTQSLPTPTSTPPAVYLSKRPGIAVMIWFVVIVSELLMARILLRATLVSPFVAGATLGSLLVMIGAPLTGVGLYALTTGAATAGGINAGRAWLRTPLAYLPVGLILIFAGAIAI